MSHRARRETIARRGRTIARARRRRKRIGGSGRQRIGGLRRGLASPDQAGA